VKEKRHLDIRATHRADAGHNEMKQYRAAKGERLTLKAPSPIRPKGIIATERKRVESQRPKTSSEEESIQPSGADIVPVTRRRKGDKKANRQGDPNFETEGDGKDSST